jgi:redox-sensitive bicupin YhaK (pirin superfamily)
MGNVEILKRGDLQLTSAGTGIRHSETTYGSVPVHFLQIWSLPQVSGLTPKYFTRHFTDTEKTNKLVPIVAPVGSEDVSEEREGAGPAPVQSPLYLYATLLSKDASVTHKLKHSYITPGQRKAYVHVIQTSGYNTGKATGNRVLLNGGLELAEGDGAFAIGEEDQPIEIKNVGESAAEVLLFDLD